MHLLYITELRFYIRVIFDAYSFTDKKLDWKLSVEFYHFVRGWNDMYRVIAVQKDLYEYVMSNLDTRRKISFWWMVWKKVK